MDEPSAITNSHYHVKIFLVSLESRGFPQGGGGTLGSKKDGGARRQGCLSYLLGRKRFGVS